MSNLAALVIANQNVEFMDCSKQPNDDVSEIMMGLTSKRKYINPKYFYDTTGSELFEQITQLPEYYPTRTERSLLAEFATEIAEYCGDACVLIEPGSGSCEKVRLLLEEVRPRAYVPMDIASEFLLQSALRLSEEFPWLNIHAICADFASVQGIPTKIPSGDRVIFYPGSTLGNMHPGEARLFLKTLRSWLAATKNGGVIIGIDLHKCPDILNAAYNDKQQVTAEFNINVLNNINAILGSDFKVQDFRHEAFYNEAEKRIEMHLVCERELSLEVAGSNIHLAKGESIHTENSYKYTLDGFSSLVSSAGLEVQQSWIDDEQLFSVHYLALG